jgi:hypothetical protein
MSANTPPDPYFNGINFNPSFFQTVIEYLTIPIANTRYLLLNGLNYMTGNLGIKRVAGVELDVNGKAYISNAITGIPTYGQYGGNSARLILSTGGASETQVALGVDGTSLWYGSITAGSHIFYTGIKERLRILSSGNVGIGTSGASSLLHLHIPDTLQEVAIRFTDQSTGTTITDGCSIFKNTVNDLLLNNFENARIAFYTNNTERMQIAANGNIGIGNYSPVNNILQIGDGARLRISNGSSDYTLIGTKEGNDDNNPRIVIFGSASSGNEGRLYYISSTANGQHKFFVNGLTTEALQINTTAAIFNNNIVVGNINTGNPRIQFGSSGSDYMGVSRPSAGGLSSSAAIGDMVINASGKLFLQSGGGFSAMCINTNNNIQLGYGYTTATFPITLNSTNFTNQSFTGYTSGIASGISTSSSFANPGIYIGIMNTTAFSVGFYIYSDKRIKKDFEPIDNSLEIIEKINLTTFKYKDYIKKGNKKNYGVIAQEIEKIVPEVINECKDYIPDIYKNANGYDGDNTIYIKVDNLIIGDKIKIYDNKNKEHHKEIIKINEDYITIDEPIEDYEDGTDLFIYGKEIPDLKNVNYEALFIVNMRATQELYKRVKALEKYFNIVY